MKVGAKTKRVVVGAICAALSLCAATQLALAGAGKPQPRGYTPITTERPVVRAGRVQVAIYLKDQSALAAWQANRNLARRAAGITASGHKRFSGREKVRENALAKLSAGAVATSQPIHLRLARLIARYGGKVTGSFPAPSVVFASLPSKSLPVIERSGFVGAVLPVGERRYLAAAQFTPAWYAGADPWHEAGCTGAGAADSACPSTSTPQSITGPINSQDGHGGPDLDVDDMGINCHHDAFDGGPTPSLGRSPAVERPADAPLDAAPGNKGCPTNVADDNGSLHGNTIAAIVAVKDPAHLGVAYGIDKLLDPNDSCTREGWPFGLPTYQFTVSAWCTQGTTYPGAADPAEVVNKSFGYAGFTGQDDLVGTQFSDAEVAQFGVAEAVSVGNGGPDSNLFPGLKACTSGDDNNPTCQYRAEHPCVGYNVICVGANHAGSDVVFRTGDDRVEVFSSRGPSVGGRKKPDLVAPNGFSTCPQGGYGGVANPTQDALWKGGTICGEGTSYSAPVVAGAQILLASVGITAPAAQKAILINSALPITREDTNTVQQYWAPDVGWGELNLPVAYAQRGNFRTGSITAPPTSNARFYRVDGQSAGEKTTLTWNRRVTIPLDSHGGYNGGWSTPAASAVTTLNLYQLTLAGADNDQDVCGSSTTCGVDSSESTDTGPKVIVDGKVQRWETNADNQDTVNQVRAKSAGDSIIKVVADSPIVGAPSEDYALASSKPLTPLSTPNLAAPTPTLSDATPELGQSVTVTAQVTNQSSGTDLVDALALDSGQASINLPSGVQLVTGSATQSLGTINPSQTKIVSWTIERTAEGSGEVTISASGTRFGATFASTSPGADITTDLTPPTLELIAPTGWQGQAANAVLWTAADTGTGLSNVTVEASIGGAPYATIYNGAGSSGSEDVTAGEGQSVTLRATATDAEGNIAQSSAPGWSVDAAPPTLNISAPASVAGGTNATVSVAAENVGSPITTSYRLDAGPMQPLTGSWITLGALIFTTQVSVTTTDQLGRSVSKGASIGVYKSPTRVRQSLSRKSRSKRRSKRRTLSYVVTPRVDGWIRTIIKCRRYRVDKILRVTNGKARMGVRRGAGRCKMRTAFTPATESAYLPKTYRKTLRL